jgi:iron(III) transport system permease protein
MVLLLPAVLAFVADRIVQRRQVAVLSARAVPLEPRPSAARDWILFAYCAVVAGLLLAILLVAAWGSLIKFWPYNLSLTLANYEFDKFDASGWGAYFNSLQLAAWTATIGTAVVFLGAYMVEKSRGFGAARGVVQLLAMLPLAVPGLVLGLAYIFFFNARWNPLGFLYATMGLLVLNTVAHFYTVSHLTAATALKQLDAEFESVGASLKVPFWTTLWRVTIPVCSPAILDIFVYLFVNAMTTVSAVIFLYSTYTKLASITVVNMDEAGFTAAAAAMSVTIVLTSAGVKMLHLALDRLLARTTHGWRRRAR